MIGTLFVGVVGIVLAALPVLAIVCGVYAGRPREKETLGGKVFIHVVAVALMVGCTIGAFQIAGTLWSGLESRIVRDSRR